MYYPQSFYPQVYPQYRYQPYGVRPQVLFNQQSQSTDFNQIYFLHFTLAQMNSFQQKINYKKYQFLKKLYFLKQLNYFYFLYFKWLAKNDTKLLIRNLKGKKYLQIIPQQWRPPVYNAPQYPYSGLRLPAATYPYNSYNPYTSSIIPPTYQQQPMLSQIMASPQRQFQSPDRLRGAQSPQRNILMQSQQVPKSPAPQLQSPNRQFLTFEQVQERIRNAQQQQPQAHQNPKQNTPQPKPNQQKQQPVAPNQNKQTAQQPKPDDDLDKRYQNALKSTEEIIKKYQMDDSGSKGRQTNQENHQAEEDGELQELALQYEDGFIYRGQGFPPQTRSGFGILTDAEGQQIYAGYWKENLYDGQGRLTNLQIEELKESVDWNNMTTIGNGWASYEGNFYQGKMHGQGTLVLTNNEQYFGEFEDGMVHGDGEFTNLDGQIIKGKWDQGYLIQLSEQD